MLAVSAVLLAFARRPNEGASRDAPAKTTYAGCTDVSGWTFKWAPAGSSLTSTYYCSDYHSGWCSAYGDDASAAGVKAKDACCACGGGVKDETKQPIQEMCADHPGWKGYKNYGCAAYDSTDGKGWCPSYATDVGTAGLMAKDACCGCGGGVKVVDKATCELIGTDDQVRKIVAAGFDLKSAGVSLDYLKTAGSPAADLKAVGFSGDDLKEVGIFTTTALLRKAIQDADLVEYFDKDAVSDRCGSGVNDAEYCKPGIFMQRMEVAEEWDVSLLEDFSDLVSFAAPRTPLHGAGPADAARLDPPSRGSSRTHRRPHTPAASQFDNPHPRFIVDISKWDVAKGKTFANMVSVARTNGGGVTANKLARAASVWAGAASLTHRRDPRALAASQFGGTANYFDADLSKWDVAKGENFERMFFGTGSFNADLSDWDVAKGKNFKDMVRVARPRGAPHPPTTPLRVVCAYSSLGPASARRTSAPRASSRACVLAKRRREW